MSNPRLRFSPELIHPEKIYTDSKDDSFLKMLTWSNFSFHSWGLPIGNFRPATSCMDHLQATYGSYKSAVGEAGRKLVISCHLYYTMLKQTLRTKHANIPAELQ